MIILILAKLKLIHSQIINLIFPRRCLGCKTPETYLCLDCVDKINRADGSETAKGVLALFDYHDRVAKKAIWQLKYHGRKEIGEILGRVAYARLIEDLAERRLWSGRTEKILVIPAPLSRQRERARGFNQSALIARAFGAGDPENFAVLEKVLIKIKNTPAQVSLKNRKARLKNLRGAFKISDRKKIKNRDVIIIDDVATTGATITECQKMLKRAGARSALPLAIASG